MGGLSREGRRGSRASGVMATGASGGQGAEGGGRGARGGDRFGRGEEDGRGEGDDAVRIGSGGAGGSRARERARMLCAWLEVSRASPRRPDDVHGDEVFDPLADQGAVKNI